MKIHSLTVSGVGPFTKQQTMNAAELDPIVAVTGRNGEGKTFFLELVPAALYARMPFRMAGQKGISLYDFMTAPTSQIDLVFEMPDGRIYRVARTLSRSKTGKTSSHNAMVSEIVPGNNGEIPLAEGADAVTAWIESNICPYPIFLASVFNSQKSTGDLVSCSPDERKQIFARLIGLGEYEQHANYYAARAVAVAKVIQEIRQRITTDRAQADNVGVLQQTITGRMSELQMCRVSLSTARADLENMKLLAARNAGKVAGDTTAQSERENALRAEIAAVQREIEGIADGIKRQISELTASLEIGNELLQINHQLSAYTEMAKNADCLSGVPCTDDLMIKCRLATNALKARDWCGVHKNEQAGLQERKIAIENEKIENGNKAAQLRMKLQKGEYAPEHAARLAKLNSDLAAVSAEKQRIQSEAPKPITTTAVDAQIANLEVRERALADELARLNGRLEEARKRELLIAAREKRAAAFDTLRADYEKLAAAFGRNGMQALIIDSERVPFVAIAQELFAIITANMKKRMELDFTTQRVLKNGSTEETFAWEIIVDGVARRLEQCSGAQQAVAQVTMRAALGIYHAMRGRGLQTYFLDETTGSLDDVSLADYVRFIQHIRKYFRQIFVVSHQAVANEIDCKLEIAGGNVRVI